MDYKSRQIEAIRLEIKKCINDSIAKSILEALENLDIQIQEEYHAEMNMVYNQDSDAQAQG